MSISSKAEWTPEPVAARVAKGRLTVDLADGRTISIPIEWYPRLAHGTPGEWRNYELNLLGIHWPDLDEDIAVEDLLAARKSGESPRSIKRWLEYRAKGQKEPIAEEPLPPELERILNAEKSRKPRASRRRAS